MLHFKKICFLLILSFVSLFPLLFSEEYIVDSDVAEAVIYSNQGIDSSFGKVFLSRRAEKILNKGFHKVSIVLNEIESKNFDDEIFKTEVLGENGVFLGTEIENIKEKIKNRSLPENETLESLKEKKENLFFEINLKEKKIKNLEEKKDFILSFNKKYVKGAFFTQDFEKENFDWFKSINANLEEIRNITKELFQLNNALKQAKKEFSDLDEWINEISDKEFEFINKKKITANVEIKKPGKYQFLFSYFGGKAKWRPQYDILIRENDDNVELKIYAVIEQMTGNDWENVDVTLADYSSLEQTDVPRLNNWKLKFKNSKKNRYIAANSSNSVKDASSGQKYYGKSFKRKNFKKKIDLKKNMESKYLFGNAELKGHMFYLARPRVSKNVFTAAEIHNSSDFLISSGAADLFIDGVHSSTIFLEELFPNEKRDIVLSLTDNFSLDMQYEDESGDEWKGVYKYYFMIMKHKVTIYTKNINNNLMVRIEDTYPISIEKDIETDVIRSVPNYSEKDEFKGIVVWNLDMSKKEKTVIEFDYKITSDEEVEYVWFY